MDNVFLEDFQEDFKYQIVESENIGKNFFIRGIISKAGVVNKNKRIYPMNVMEEAIGKIQEAVSSGGFVGQLDHPADPKVQVDKISHKITKLELANDGAVLAEMIVLDTSKGQELKKLIQGGVKLGVSTRALGGVKPLNNNQIGENILEVQPGLNLKAVDVVFDPSAGEFGSPNFVMESSEEESNSESKLTLNEIIEEQFS